MEKSECTLCAGERLFASCAVSVAKQRIRSANVTVLLAPVLLRFSSELFDDWGSTDRSRTNSSVLGMIISLMHCSFDAWSSSAISWFTYVKPFRSSVNADSCPRISCTLTLCAPFNGCSSLEIHSVFSWDWSLTSSSMVGRRQNMRSVSTCFAGTLAGFPTVRDFWCFGIDAWYCSEISLDQGPLPPGERGLTCTL